MKYKLVLFLLVLSLFLYCTAKKNNNIPVPISTNTQGLSIQADSVADHSNDFQLETGIIKEAEDAGYPLLSVTIKFPQRNWEESFNLNVEEIKVSQKQILNGIGKPVAIAFEKEMNAALMDLQSEGKSIFAITTSANERQLKKITGTLSGAENHTAGDRPGTITIVSTNKEKVSFQYFITPEIVRYNGKTLTALYADRIYNRVLKFKML